MVEHRAFLHGANDDLQLQSESRERKNRCPAEKRDRRQSLHESKEQQGSLTVLPKLTRLSDSCEGGNLACFTERKLLMRATSSWRIMEPRAPLLYWYAVVVGLNRHAYPNSRSGGFLVTCDSRKPALVQHIPQMEH